jgi:hypothetical protein
MKALEGRLEESEDACVRGDWNCEMCAAAAAAAAAVAVATVAAATANGAW